MAIRVQIPDKLVKLVTTPKRLKILVGGRGSGKTVTVSDCMLRFADLGQKILGAREFQNSIDDSVHSSIISRIGAHNIENRFNIFKSEINAVSGGRIFYRGLARNIGSMKSLDGVDKVWIEEGQYLSQESLDVLLPTIREEGSEIWVTMNRRFRNDPISKILEKAEKDLAKTGYYEDEYMIIVQVNYNDNPWFPDVLEQERVKDKKTLPPAKYRHIWEGDYGDTVENAIIYPDWFNACIDAHKTLGIKIEGIKTCSHDPSDIGPDDKAFARRQGILLKDLSTMSTGDVSEGCDWAIAKALSDKPDIFIWDADGMGTALKRPISEALGPKKIELVGFSGASGVQDPGKRFDPVDGDFYAPSLKTNKDVFYNRRAQAYWDLRTRIYLTYEAIEKGEYKDPHTLISFPSDLPHLDLLRSELCAIPRKDNGIGKIQLCTKQEMLKMGISSPNCADAVMMAFSTSTTRKRKDRELTYPTINIA
jgi:phage terminase large subunit